MVSKKRNHFMLFTIIILIFSLLTGCGNKDKKEEVKDKVESDDYEINLGYYNCDHMVPACIGEAAGIYKDMGLNVKVTGNGKVPEAMAAGQMDAGYIGNGGLIGSKGKGAPIKAVANNHDGGSRYLVVANDIEKPEDLYGQKIAIGDPTKAEMWVAGFSHNLGLSKDENDYELINIGTDADKYVALSTGQIKGYTA